MPVTTYTTINGEIVSENRNGVKRDYLPDPLGNTIALLDANQQKTDTFSYWPYGELKSRTGTTPTPMQYVGSRGYYRDKIQRVYVRARHLDVARGRFVTKEPRGPDGGEPTPYRYARASPAQFIDPSGLEVDPCRVAHLSQFVNCWWVHHCVRVTEGYYQHAVQTGNMFSACLSCVSWSICAAIAVGSTLGFYKLLAAGAACENRCLQEGWLGKLTPQWQQAAHVCRLRGERSRECCEASLMAEQLVYGDCAAKCFPGLNDVPYDWRTNFGLNVLQCCTPRGAVGGFGGVGTWRRANLMA